MLGAVRANNDSFTNESDQDANSMLTELDKGLRSTKIGEQCEAIIRFPKLFEKYPFPILINSSFLKLAEFFRIGSNLLRLWILRVCQQSEKHLEKILSVDEFVKRIFMVIHSNDPVARALTLRTLGAVAYIIPEKQPVHHAIRKALDSHDTVEVEAAIHASVQFAAQSKSFAISMCSKVAKMIESLQTPISMKIQLVPVLKHMHHDANTAALVKSLCINLLPKYPSENFVIVILESLSRLSCKTLVDIPDQVNLLLEYLYDPRKNVRVVVLNSLKQLATSKGAHLWPKGTIQTLLSIAMSKNNGGNEQSLLLSVILTLTKCPVTCQVILEEERELLLELCSTCVLHDHNTSVKALSILTSLVSYCYSENIEPPANYVEQLNQHLEYLIYSSATNEERTKAFSQYLKCGVELSKKNLSFGKEFTELIGGLLNDDIAQPTKHSALICESLAALCAQYVVPSAEEVNNTNPFHTLLPSILKKLELIATNFDRNQTQIVELLSAICFQSSIGYIMPNDILIAVEKVLKLVNYWSQYKIARSASRYGHHFLAGKIYQKLSKHVSLEKYHYYLISLLQVSKAECILNYGFQYEALLVDYSCVEDANSQAMELPLTERLDKAINLYSMALATLKASSSPQHPLTFQSELIRLRGLYLEALFNVVIACNTQQACPPPAIAQALAQHSRDHLQKFGHITNQLRKSIKIIKQCEDSYAKLYKSSFDADPCSLEYLEIIQQQCAVLGHNIETVCFATPSDIPILLTMATYPETKYLVEICKKVSIQRDNLPNESGLMKTITNKHTDMIIKCIEIITKSAHCLPRFFFQVLQNTSIKLALTPQPRVAGEPVFVQPNSNLVVKVEGVIQHSARIQKLFRSIDNIQLTLQSQLITQRPNDMKSMSDTLTLSQTVKPHRDFLSGSFLLPLNNSFLGGQWMVTLEACVIDQDGIIWNTGPKSVLNIRVPERNQQQV